MLSELKYILSYYYHTLVTSEFVQRWISKWHGVSIAEKTHQSLRIRYLYEGKEYLVYLPFEKRYINKMINSNVELIYPDGHTTPLVQQPGVPYLIAPKHLGATSASVTSLIGTTQMETHQKIEI